MTRGVLFSRSIPVVFFLASRRTRGGNHAGARATHGSSDVIWRTPLPVEMFPLWRLHAGSRACILSFAPPPTAGCSAGVAAARARRPRGGRPRSDDCAGAAPLTAARVRASRCIVRVHPLLHGRRKGGGGLPRAFRVGVGVLYPTRGHVGGRVLAGQPHFLPCRNRRHAAHPNGSGSPRRRAARQPSAANSLSERYIASTRARSLPPPMPLPQLVQPLQYISYSPPTVAVGERSSLHPPPLPHLAASPVEGVGVGVGDVGIAPLTPPPGR